MQRVTLYGPFPLLSSGVRLYDVPGTHDENAARAAVMKSIIAQASTVLITSNIRRACNDKGAKDMMPLLLRRALLAEFQWWGGTMLASLLLVSCGVWHGGRRCWRKRELLRHSRAVKGV